MQNIIDARTSLLDLDFVQSMQSSSLYLSSPVGYSEQADFINCAVSLMVECDAAALFEGMCEIENQLGRTRDVSNQNAARIIDLDLLIFGDLQNDDVDLTIPHPRISERLFVLEPLAELTPDLIVPMLGDIEKIIIDGIQQNRFIGQKIHRLGA